MKNQRTTLLRGNKKSIAFLKKLFVFVLSNILFSACNPTENLLPEKSSTLEPYIIDIEDAIRVAQKYDIVGNNQLKTKQNLRIEAKEIETKETVFDEDKNVLFYVINYAKETGFIIISADLRAIPVLAYSDKGNFKIKDISAGVLEWFNSSKQQIKDIKRENKDITPIVAKIWKQYLSGELNIPKLKGGRVSNTNCYEWYTVGQYMCQNSTSSAGPFLNTNWGQSGTATGLLSSNSSCNACNRYNAGCGPVAIAQI